MSVSLEYSVVGNSVTQMDRRHRDAVAWRNLVSAGRFRSLLDQMSVAKMSFEPVTFQTAKR